MTSNDRPVDRPGVAPRHLYYITDKSGPPRQVHDEILAQRALFDTLHTRMYPEGAARAASTTFIQLYMLMPACSHENIRAGTPSPTRYGCEAIFRDKIRFPMTICATRKNQGEGAGADRNSAIAVAQQFRHPGRHLAALRHAAIFCTVSDTADLRRNFPRKAREVRTGPHTVERWCVFVESTAKADGHFFELCQPRGAQEYRRSAEADGLQVHSRPGTPTRPTRCRRVVPIPAAYQTISPDWRRIASPWDAGPEGWYVKKASSSKAT